MLIRGFAVQAARPTRPTPLPEICRALHVDYLVPMITPPPRNRPCPCGSGSKAKHCCWAMER